MRNTGAWLGAVTALSLFLLAGLPGPSLALTPCQLLTHADAEQILGEPVAEPRLTEVVGMAAGQKCFIHTAAPLAQRGGVGAISLISYDKATMESKDGLFTSPQKFFERILSVQKSSKPENISEISGLGDKAFWSANGDTLHCLKGDHYLTLEVRDLIKMSAPNRQELDQKLSQHRRALTEKVMKQYVLPRLAKP